MTRVVSAVAFLMAVVAGPRCGSEGATTPTEDVEESEVLSLVAGAEVRYRPTWSWDGAIRDEATAAWVFQTDRGYTVGLRSVHMGLGTLQLVPCQQTTASGASWVARARANHSSEDDPTLLAVARVESATDEPAELGPVPAAGHDYCSLHQAFTPLDGPASDGFVADGTSAAIEGFYEGPDGQTRSFDASVWLSDGAVVALRVIAVTSPGTSATVEVQRRPALALDGQELDALSDAELAHVFLRGLARTTSVTVEVP